MAQVTLAVSCQDARAKDLYGIAATAQTVRFPLTIHSSAFAGVSLAT
jgi:hypothetical protein